MAYSKEELNEAYKNLPPELKEVISSLDTANQITAVGKKYNLHVDQLGVLNSETGYVLLGLSHPTEFVSSLTRGLNVDRVVASQIASDINDQIFLRIRELLKDIKNKEKEGATEEIEPQPSKDALLAALEHPEGMLKRPVQVRPEIPLVEVRNPYAPAKAEMGKDFPVVAPTPITPVAKEEGVVPTTPAPAEDLLSQKFGGEVSMPKVDTQVDAPTKKFDPYKEQV